MPQFSKQSTRPLSPESYRAAARKLRTIADHLDARATPETPREKAALTSTIHGLSLFAQALSRRHRRPQMITCVNFTDSAKARFIDFLRTAYGAEYFANRVNATACESECLQSFDRRLEADEPLSWELRMTHTGQFTYATFDADESDLLIDRRE